MFDITLEDQIFGCAQITPVTGWSVYGKEDEASSPLFLAVIVSADGERDAALLSVTRDSVFWYIEDDERIAPL